MNIIGVTVKKNNIWLIARANGTVNNNEMQINPPNDPSIRWIPLPAYLETYDVSADGNNNWVVTCTEVPTGDRAPGHFTINRRV